MNEEFHDTAIFIVKIIGEYGELLKYYTDEIKNNISNITKEFKKAKEEVKNNNSSSTNYSITKYNPTSSISTIDNNTFNSSSNTKPKLNIFNISNSNNSQAVDFSNIFGESKSFNIINESEDNRPWWKPNLSNETNAFWKSSPRSTDYSNILDTYNNFTDPIKKAKYWDDIYNNPNIGSSIKIGMQINIFMDSIGKFISSGMDSLGDLSGHLFMKLGDGVEHTSYCIDIINKYGFDAFLNDPQCMSYVKDGIIYGTIFLGIIMIVRVLLRKVTAFLAWLSGYRQRKD